MSNQAEKVTHVNVEETLTGRYMQRARDGRHVLTIDEPAELGGNDAGPDPYEYLLMALGGCTCMTLRMYAELKQIPLKRIRVRLSHQKVHAQDCADAVTKTGKIDHINREIELQGELTEDQRQRLLDIANRCPVHQTLSTENVIHSSLAPTWQSQPWDAEDG